MKSIIKKRILALVLCMVLMLSSSISAMASSAAEEIPAPENTADQEAAAASIEEETTEPETQNNETPAAEDNTSDSAMTDETADTTPTADSSVAGTTDLVGGATGQEPEVNETTETPETTEPKEEPEEEILSEATELKQEFTDENGNVAERVTANLPEGAFNAKASEITMEVNYPEEAAEKHIKDLMTKALPENNILGDYILYDIKFKVNGVVTESREPITITFEGSGLHIEDVKKANVFYLDPADPEVEGDKDEIVEITQKSEMLESLKEAGQSTENIDEYDLSEISVKEDKTANKIVMEGRKSVVYGCYVEETPAPVQTLKYEDKEVIINVSADKEGIIPEGASLKVVPIQKDSEETKEQYNEVEEQLNKKAENEEYDIAGFLAYDISFVDVEGNKVEPNGDVKVTMEYKEEALPEELKAEDVKESDVTILHLEEDAQGKVEKVVDMAATDQLKEVETTEQQKVQKAEFITGSFSAFTVTWTVNKQPKTVNVYLYDLDGNSIATTNDSSVAYSKPLGNKDNVSLKELASDFAKYISKDYIYAEGRLNSIYGQKANRISYNSGRKNVPWCYENNGWKDWRFNGTPSVYLLYDKPLTTATTVDNAVAGISMKMVDLIGYDANGYENSEKGNTFIGVSGGEKVKIGGGYTIDKVDGRIKQGLLENVLPKDEQGVPGYPLTTGEYDGKKGKDLGKIFSTASPVNHLFLQSTYDETGYLEYSSFSNYAYLNTEGENKGNFTVYNHLGTPEDNEAYFYRRGNFMPYNKILPGRLSTRTNDYDEDGKELTGGRKGERLYLTEGKNYYFGMTMEAEFLQPKNGKISETDEDMVFEFNGDDDLWIYIDNVLVLDIGGIHDAHSGYINFSTGEVGVYDCAKGKEPQLIETNLKDMFFAAKTFPNGDQWDEDEVDKHFSGNTFVNYTQHTFKMFYMERGAGASNLHIKFNLQTIPEGQIEVRKELSNTDKEKYANEDFEFQVYVQEKEEGSSDENPSYTESYVPLTDELIRKEKITAKLKGTDRDIEFDDNGSFYLKSDQSAVISGLKANRKYYVTEVGVKSNEYDKVVITGTSITGYDEDERVISKETDVTSKPDTVGDRPFIVFTNNCSGENSRELRITKYMEGNFTEEETFSFKIRLTNQDNQLVDYVNGDYYLKDSDGYYYYYDEDNKLIRNEPTPESDKPSIVCGKTDSDGIVPKVPVGYTVVITGILSGTSFQVEEVDLNGVFYFPPIKEVLENTCEKPEIEKADGMISLGKHAEVEITNRRRVNALTIKKIDSDDQTKVLKGAVFELHKWNGKEFIPIKIEEENWQLTTGEDGTVVFNDLENGKYKVIEVKEPDGYVLDDKQKSFEIELPYKKGVPEDESISVDDSSRLEDNSYSDVTKTVLNHRKTWEIIKSSSSSKNMTLPGAEFTLQPENIGDAAYYGKSQDDGKVIWYKNSDFAEKDKITESEIVPGIYKLQELKAPTGYVLSQEIWKITIGQNGSWVEATGIINRDNIVEKGNKITCYFENTAIYELPSAGGPGIFLYIIGGILLMMAGALILYKNKYREVLKK